MHTVIESLRMNILATLERSGKKELDHCLQTCSKLLRQTFAERADKTRHDSYWAGIHYLRQQEKGKPHNTTLGTLAFKWIRIIYSCWKNKSFYDEPK